MSRSPVLERPWGAVSLFEPTHADSGITVLDRMPQPTDDARMSDATRATQTTATSTRSSGTTRPQGTSQPRTFQPTSLTRVDVPGTPKKCPRILLETRSYHGH